MLCVAAVLAAGCGEFPLDPEGTLKRIRAEKSFRVGIVAPRAESGADPKMRALLDRVAARAGATPRLEQGQAEPLLDRLEQGELDLVLGRFEKKSPWASLVTFGPPLRVEREGKTVFHVTGAMRNGENGWIALVERAARDVAPEAQ